MLAIPPFNITWVNPVFLDYRVSVYTELDALIANRLTMIYSRDRINARVDRKIRDALGSRAIGLEGGRALRLGIGNTDFANGHVDLPYQRGLAAAIRNSRPELLIAEGFFQWTPAAVWQHVRTRVPLVVAYERTTRTERNAGNARTRYRRWICRHFVGAVSCNGRLSKEYCTRVLGCDPESVVTGSMAADTTTLEKAAQAARGGSARELRASLKLAAPVFLCVGRLVIPKGLRQLTAAWKRHTQKMGPLAGSMLIVGSGPEEQWLREKIREWDLPNIHLTGAIDHDEIPQVYAAADVLITPTLEDNWSLVVPEAMACSLPILSSCHNGCWPELVKAENGIVFDSEDPEQIAEALGFCAANPDRLPDMGRASRSIVNEFSPSRAAQAVLRAALTARGKAQPAESRKER